MKSLVYFLLLIMFVSCSSKENAKEHHFYANVAQSVITPPVGTYLIEPRGEFSTGIHDDLFVKAVALGDGKNIFVIVSFDLIGFDDSLAGSIRKAVYDSAGIKAEQLMLSCTHTHNSPITLNAMDPLPEKIGEGKSKRDLKWEKRMIAITAGTVKSAVDNLKEVSISQGKASVQVGFNRRLNQSTSASMIPNPNGPVLKETDVVTIKDNESVIALLFSYAAHPVSVHSTSTEFSADYPGYAVQAIKSEYPVSTPVFLQGCAGNVNSTLRGGYEAAETDGKKLGDAVLKSAENSKIVAPAPILYDQRKFFLPFRDIDIETADLIIKRIEESLKTLEENSPDFKLSMSQMDIVNWAHRLKYLAENKDSHPGLPFQAHAIALGRSLAIIAFPDELFVDYAIYLKEHSPFEQTIVLGYTGGSESYIPSAEAFFLGGYETGYAQQAYGQPFLTPACDKIIKTESLKLLNELYKKGSYRKN